MAWVRKLVRQGGTHLVTIPIRCIEVMGIRAGDHVCLQQPFSGALIVTPLEVTGRTEAADAVRALGYALGRVDVEEVARRFVLRKLESEVTCTCCRRWPSSWEIIGGAVCDLCRAEMANVIRLRQEPSQVEMEIVP